MNTGKTLFAQLMDFLPWSTFSRIVSRYDGDRAVRTLSCAAQFRVMAFAQLTYRESLRDIEACLSAQAGKLYHMGFRDRVHRSTLADANEARDWRIYAEFAQRLIGQARRLYAGDDLGLDLSSTVYALDSTTIDLCLSVFPWAHFRSTKGAVKMHTLLDLRGNIPSFIHVSDGKLHDIHALDMLLPEAGAIYVMDRGYVDFFRLYVLHQAGLSSTSAAHPLQGRGDRQDADLPHQPGNAAGPDDLRPLQKPLASGAVLQVDQAASAHQAVLRHLGERGEDPDLDRSVGVCPGRHRQKAAGPGGIALHIAAGHFRHSIREDADPDCVLRTGQPDRWRIRA
jgi:hypothetical protein